VFEPPVVSSIHKGTHPQSFRPSFHIQVHAVRLHMTSLKGVSGMKPRRDIGVMRKTAWFALHSIRNAFENGSDGGRFVDPVKADGIHVGGPEKGRHGDGKPKAGRDGVGKSVFVAMKDREMDGVSAKVTDDTKAKTPRGFMEELTEKEAECRYATRPMSASTGRTGASATVSGNMSAG